VVTLLLLLSGCSSSITGEESAQVGNPGVLAESAPRGRRGDALVFGHAPRNLLVISLDTTRRDRVGFFDEDLTTTPNLDAAFADGVILEDHRSCSNWTSPSAYCAHSGRSYLDDDVWLTSGIETWRDRRVDWPADDAPTLASILSSAGFDTTLVTANDNFSSQWNGTAYGFDHEIKKFWRDADVVVETAIAESQKLGADGERWYFHVHFVDPHESYTAPRAYDTDPHLECPWTVAGVNVQNQIEGGELWGRLDEKEREEARACLFNLYEGELRYWDEHFGEMWTDFEARGLLDDTLVVFWTDHGQSFGEHDDKFDHGATLYDTENRSTAAFWANDIEPLRWTGPTTHEDLAPTILDALGVPLGDHTGRILGHARYDRVRIAFNYLEGYTPTPIISAIRGDDKLMYWWDGTRRFYDLASDPDETDDVYDPDDPAVIALWDELEPVIAHTQEVWPGLRPHSVGP
jgi:arylsulfatase A-like enzyme